MEKASKDVLRAAIIGFCIPLLLLILVIVFLLSGNAEKPNLDTTVGHAPKPSIGVDESIRSIEIPVLLDDAVCMIDLEEYVVGAVLAEMPASFGMEALKAQAVAARTYALKICTDGKKHEGAVCGSHLCCQSYMTEEDYLLKGWNQRYVQRVREAVYATAGQVITYEGELIRATYFSCSGGCTEDAVQVWGRDYPYLQSVKSPGEEETVYFTDTREFVPEELQDALGVPLTGGVDTWFGEITYTDGGGVDTMVIGGVTYRGTTLRSLLGLRSTVFEVVASENRICFITKGYGHRVGMSQYGADAMAAAGADYESILCHYYAGTALANYAEISQTTNFLK